MQRAEGTEDVDVKESDDEIRERTGSIMQNLVAAEVFGSHSG